MAKGIILIICGFLLFLFPYVSIIGIVLFLYGIYCTLKGLKKFIFELIDHIKGTGTGASGASKKDYTREAREACEKVTPKRKRDATPPWEE